MYTHTHADVHITHVHDAHYTHMYVYILTHANTNAYVLMPTYILVVSTPAY